MDNTARFEILYRQFFTPVYKFCFRVLNSREGALDAVQETFIKYYERMKQGGSEIENNRAWLYKVAGNLCINAVNKKTRHNQIEGSLDVPFIDNSNPEDILIDTEKNNLVRNAIRQLTPENRLLIMMYQDGLSYREISEATGIKYTSVGNTLWRAIDKMTENIKLQTHE
jgi:RNA polymerase sigma-70 factor (ECF subfamily)